MKTLKSLVTGGILVAGIATSLAGQGQRMNPLGSGRHARAVPAPTVGLHNYPLPANQVPLVQWSKAAIKRTSKVAVSPSVLVLYDSQGPYGFVGSVYARQLGNLLTHFHANTTILPVEQYQTGMMNSNTATFYLGTTFENTLPASFTSDAMSTTHPLCWMGYNLWRIAWTPDYSSFNQAFLTKFGFEFNYMDSTVFTAVNYNGTSLATDPYSAGEANVTIYKSSLAKVVGRYSNSAGQTLPYMIHSGNFWFVTENPLQDSSTNLTATRTLAFEDTMHDILNDGVTASNSSHNAVLRLEDVHANTDPDALMALADTLYAQKVPFAINVIPHYRDPLGVYNDGTPVDITINDQPALIAALQYCQTKGGQVIEEGDTHQYDDTVNTTSGVTAEDYEFYRFAKNSSGVDYPLGAAFEDSASWVDGRISEGLSILAVAGFKPTGWVTPHYFASPLDYAEFQKYFQYSMCRGSTFTVDNNGFPYYVQQELSWPVTDDQGMVRLPENLGYVAPAPYGVGQLPTNLISLAKKRLAVRDGWVGCYFHPFIAASYLKQLVVGIKKAGYTFVNPSASLAK